MVLPNSHKISRVPWYLGAQSRRGLSTFAYRTSTFCGQPFQAVRLDAVFVTLRPSQHSGQIRSRDPRRTTVAALHTAGFRLFPVRSPLLRKSRFLSFPAVSEMFQFAALATRAYGFSTCQFGNSGIIACLTAPPDFSQSSTPFKAS